MTISLKTLEKSENHFEALRNWQIFKLFNKPRERARKAKQIAAKRSVHVTRSGRTKQFLDWLNFIQPTTTCRTQQQCFAVKCHSNIFFMSHSRLSHNERHHRIGLRLASHGSLWDRFHLEWLKCNVYFTKKIMLAMLCEGCRSQSRGRAEKISEEPSKALIKWRT